jgi:hypothetical protein
MLTTVTSSSDAAHRLNCHAAPQSYCAGAYPTDDVAHKDAAATQWCDNATTLTKTLWEYLKIPQKAFEVLQPSRLAELKALAPSKLF